MTAPRYTPDSEGYLAGVWYVMRAAQESYSTRPPGKSKWAFLLHVQRKLGLRRSAEVVSYRQMREELAEFAATFGIEGEHRAVASPQDRAAASVFAQEDL